MFGDTIVPLSQVNHVWISNCVVNPGNKRKLPGLMEQLDIQA
jgi:hypothetical protein